MVIWATPIVLSSAATTASGMECQAVAAPQVVIGGSTEQATGPVEFANSRSEPNLLRGWCEVHTAVGLRRTSVTLSGAAVVDWPATQGLMGRVELQIDMPKTWQPHEDKEAGISGRSQRLTGSPAQLLSRLATYPIKRLRFSYREVPIEIRPSHKDDLALLVIGDDEYLILTTPRVPGDRVYRRIARQLVLNAGLNNNGDHKHYIR